MPLVRIDLREGTSPETGRRWDGLHRALGEAFAVLPDDRFQVITEHPANDLIYDAQYLLRAADGAGCVCANQLERGKEAAAEAQTFPGYG